MTNWNGMVQLACPCKILCLMCALYSHRVWLNFFFLWFLNNNCNRPRKERMTLFYFNGNLGPAYENGRPEDTCVFSLKEYMIWLHVHLALLNWICTFGTTTWNRGENQHWIRVQLIISGEILCWLFPHDLNPGFTKRKCIPKF